MTFQCTVCDEGAIATQWTGSVLECVGNSILLRHSQFINESGSTGECNNVIARSIGVKDTNGTRCFVSQLSFITSSDHNNKTIVCQYINSTNITVVDEIVIFFVTGMEFC